MAYHLSMATRRPQQGGRSAGTVADRSIQPPSNGQLRPRGKRGVPHSALLEEGREAGKVVTAPVAVRRMTKAQARKLFDETADSYLHMSGEEFLRRWDAGQYPDPDADTRVMNVAMLIPLVR